MDYQTLNCFKVSIEKAVANVTIDYAPINLMDMNMIGEMYQLAKLLAEDDTVKAIVFRSADPEFFIAHADLNLLLDSQKSPPDPSRLNLINKSLELFRTMPKVSIAQIEGQAQGGGSEFALGLDMRFAAIGKARLGQPETALGIIPGGGGCTRLPRLLGRGRALEILLGCETFSAQEAAHYGYVNRALPADEISGFVAALAERIASFPADALAAVKEVVNTGENLSIEESLIVEQKAYAKVAALPESTRRIKKALALGWQQRELEKCGFDGLVKNIE